MKILCSDFDGTLSHGGIGKEKLEAIHAWRAKGNKFGIISGRRASFYRDLKKEHTALELDFVATCNGGIILDGAGEVLLETPCTDMPVAETVQDLLSPGTRVLLLAIARFLLF